jgi:AcrR family transcriptional regulator
MNEALREGLRESTDPRVSRTRAAILAAVQSFSDSPAEMSVSAITREAGISRASFYSHFSGLDELATSLHREAFLAIGELFRLDQLDGPDALRRSQKRLVAHFAENRALYSAVAVLPASKESHLASVRAMAAIIEQTLDAHPALPAGLQPAATARYIAGAAYGLLDAWVAGDVDLDDDLLADHLVRLLPPWFSNDR